MNIKALIALVVSLFLSVSLSKAANVAWVSFHSGDDSPSAAAAAAGFTQAPDVGYTQLLAANGHNVTRIITSATPDAAVLNQFDLVIVSRSVPSGNYQNAAATLWNGISAPMIVMGGYTLRNSRMGFTTGGTIPDTVGDVTLTVDDTSHPIFQGISLGAGNSLPYATAVSFLGTVERGISVNTDPLAGGGVRLATVGTVGDPAFGGMLIGEWQAGATMGNGTADTLAGHRLVLLSGTREHSGLTSEGAGIYDLTADGAQLFLNAVKYMAPDDEGPGDAGVVLLQDNFNANTANTRDLNVDIERQTGTLAPVTYSLGNGTSGNHQLQNVGAPDQLLLAGFAQSTVSPNYNFNGIASVGGLKISFDLDSRPLIYSTGTDQDWGCINIGASQANQLVNVNQAAPHFGILFRAAGTIQAFVANAVVSPAPEPVYTTNPRGVTNHIELVMTDADGNPFDGVGDTKIEVFVNGGEAAVYTYTVVGGFADNYFNLQANGVSHFDNLTVTQLPEAPLPTIANHSFEADTFTVFPGYVSGNGPITGWASAGGAGINPGGGSPFADNGTIPDGSQVAFIQEDNTALSQVVEGFVVGRTYQLRFYENARNCCNGTSPHLQVTVGGNTVVADHAVPPVGGTNPYREVISDPFIAGSPSLEIAFLKTNPEGGDTTVLIDNVGFLPSGTPPMITTQPQSQIVGLGDTVTFSVTAVGSAPLAFQWSRDNTPIPGANDSSLTFSATSGDQGNYSVEVSNGSGSVTSDVVSLAVRDKVPGLFNTGVDDNGVVLADHSVDPHYQIIVNPNGASPDAIVEDSSVFPILAPAGPWLANNDQSKWIGPDFNTVGSAGAAGVDGNYTYRLSFDLAGFDPASVTLTGNWSSDNAGVDILINGVSTGITTDGNFGALHPFTINSGLLAGPNNVDFVLNNASVGYTGLRVQGIRALGNALPAGTAPFIVEQPQSIQRVTTETAFFSVRANGSAPLSYQWYLGPDALPGETGPTLSFYIDFPDLAGEYSVEVSNAFGSLHSTPATLTVSEAPKITQQPQDKVAIAGDIVTFTVAAIGDPPLGYQWRKDGEDILGAESATYAINGVTANDVGVYSVLVFNFGGETLSDGATLTLAARVPGLFNTGVDDNGVALVSGTLDPHWIITQSADPAFPGPDAFALNDAGFPIPPWLANDEFSKWIAPQADQSVGNLEGDYTYETTVDLTGFDPDTISVTGEWATDNTGLDILINGISTGQQNIGQFVVWTPFSINSGFKAGINTLTFKMNNAPPGTNPTGFRVQNLRAVGVKLPDGTAPFILAQPESIQRDPGQTATFTVVANGSAPVSYQWFFGDDAIPGANGPTLSFLVDFPDLAGAYRVVVSNPFGSIISDDAILTVFNPNQPPSFTKGPDVMVDEDAGPVSIANWATDIDPGSPDEAGQVLTFHVSSDNASLFAVLPAISSDGTLSFTTAPNAYGEANLEVYLMDDGGTDNGGSDTSATETFVIKVLAVNDAPTCSPASGSGDEDTTITIMLSGSDVEDGTLEYILGDLPANGTVTLLGNEATYHPNLNYSGPDGFTFKVRDSGGLESGYCPVTITVNPVNDLPVPVIEVSPLADLGPTVPGLIVISPDGVTGCVVLDGTKTSDVDNDYADLSFAWYVGEDLVAEGDVASVCLDIGVNQITLRVDDGQGIGAATVAVEVLTPSEAVEELIMVVNDSVVERKVKQPFLASLKAAVASFDRDSYESGPNQLKAFQNKVRAQVAKTNPDVAEEWIRIAQEILDAISAP